MRIWPAVSWAWLGDRFRLGFLRRRRGHLLLLVLALVPLVVLRIWPKSEDVFVYPYLGVVQLLTAALCLRMAREHTTTRLRWWTIASILVLRATVYALAEVRGLHWSDSEALTPLVNIIAAVSWTLFLPAMTGIAAERGRLVRALDIALTASASVLLALAISSGKSSSDGDVRVYTLLFCRMYLTISACIGRVASKRPELRVFTSLVMRYLAMMALISFLTDVVDGRWLPQANDLYSDVLLDIPELLLCLWIVKRPYNFTPWWPRVDGALVDSLQPSLLALGSVLLALFGLRHHSVWAAAVVVLMVSLYAVRTQLFFYRLFRERNVLTLQKQKFEELAIQDPLTGIGNRRRLEQCAQSCLGSTATASLLLIDTDHFKQINDRFGHGAGDTVLCLVATALTAATSEVSGACCVRLGGDEFAALLPGVPGDRAEAMAEAFCEQVRTADPIEAGATKVARFTVSVGIAATKEQPITLERMLRWADAALYNAKAAGRDCVKMIDLTHLRGITDPAELRMRGLGRE